MFRQGHRHVANPSKNTLLEVEGKFNPQLVIPIYLYYHQDASGHANWILTRNLLGFSIKIKNNHEKSRRRFSRENWSVDLIVSKRNRKELSSNSEKFTGWWEHENTLTAHTTN